MSKQYTSNFCQSLGGLCCEHSKDHNLRINNYEAMEQLAETVHGSKPTVHYVKEATVIGIAPFRRDDYDVRPIVISGTCKTETASGSVNMFLTHGELIPMVRLVMGLSGL